MPDIWVVKDRHGKSLGYCSSEKNSINFMIEYIKKYKEFSVAGWLGFIVDCCEVDPSPEIVVRIKSTKTYHHDCFDHVIYEDKAI